MALALFRPTVLDLAPALKSIIREYYIGVHRSIVQIEPTCANYDPELTYTLKPGNCRFNNIEFQTGYSINSLGLRDSEESLVAPEIIALGDSFTMGWGVNGSETFAKVLENRTGKKVLNAGISSYGTAREVLLLKRLDQSNLKHLIVQYNSGDFFENDTFVDNGWRLPISSEAHHLTTGQAYRNNSEYYFRQDFSVLIPQASIANNENWCRQ